MSVERAIWMHGWFDTQYDMVPGALLGLSVVEPDL